MDTWRELLHRSGLTPDELRRIPAASCENTIALLEYYLSRGLITEHEALANMECDAAFLRDPHNWVNAYQIIQFMRNRRTFERALVTHHDYFQIGRTALFKQQSLASTLFSSMPFKNYLERITGYNKTMNNMFVKRTESIGPGRAVISIEDYPYFRDYAFGGECHWSAGAFAATADNRGLPECSVAQPVCGKRLRNLVEFYYAKFGWHLDERNGLVYLNNRPVARRAPLKELVNDQGMLAKVISGKRMAEALVTVFTTEVALQDRVIFHKGEIYDAPCCLLECVWHEASLAGRLAGLFRRRPPDTRHFDQIHQQIIFGNQQLFAARQALHESQHRLSILEVYTKKR
jgi:hypothetical protein